MNKKHPLLKPNTITFYYDKNNLSQIYINLNRRKDILVTYNVGGNEWRIDLNLEESKRNFLINFSGNFLMKYEGGAKFCDENMKLVC